MNADDFYGPGPVAAAGHFLENNHSDQFCCIGYPLSHTLSPNGPVSRGIIQVDAQNFVTSIAEMVKIQQISDGSIAGYLAHTGKEKDDIREDFPILLRPQQPVSLNLFGLNGNIFPVLEQKIQNFL
jgi:hypothetical protein